MKKSTGVILVLIIVLLLGVIGVGGYFIIKGNDDTNKKIDELKNEVVSSRKNSEVTSNTTSENSTSSNTTKNDDNQKSPNIVTAFSEKDLEIGGFKLGESAKAVESKYGTPTSSKQYTEDATGRNIVKLDYESNGLTVENSVSDNNPDGSMIRISIHGKSTLQTARGIKIGDSKQKILQSYPSSSILDNGGNTGITVGFPNDDPVYETNKGKIYFDISNDKVTGITFAYGFAE